MAGKPGRGVKTMLFVQRADGRDDREEEARAETFKQAGGVDWLSWARNNFQEIRRL